MIKYIYFRFYQLMVSVGNGDIAGFASIGLMTIMIFLHLGTIWFIEFDLGKSIEIPRFVAWVVIVCVPSLLYFLLMYNGKSKKIVEKFRGEDPKARLTGRIVVVSYMILSFVAFIVSMFMNPGIVW